MSQNKQADNNSQKTTATDKVADVADKSSHFLFGVGENKTPRISRLSMALYVAGAILIPTAIILLAAT